MSEDQKQPTVDVVDLVDAGVPADQGLSSLGLLMQLAGSVLAAYATLATFVMVLSIRTDRGEDKLWILLVLALCVGRSMIHRLAGTELLYGKRRLDGSTVSPLAGVKRYVVLGLAQSALLTGIIIAKLGVPAKFAVGIGAGLAAWPVTLGVFLQLPRFKRFSTEVPVSEDKGFEAAAILMTVLGLCGVLGTGAFLLIMLDEGGKALQQGPGVLLMLATVMLVIRSGLHVQAGLSGLRETSVDRSVELANRYANFGVISSFCAGGAMLLLLMTARLDFSGLVLISGLVWMLMAWPMIVRRFFSERQFADLLAGDNASLHRRAPDAGVTGMGWLLVGHAAFSAAFLIPQLVLGEETIQRGITEMLSFMGPMTNRSLWWSVGLIGLQGWAGFELIRMGPHHRVIGTVYAVIAAVLTTYMTWPILQSLGQMGAMGPTGFAMFIPLAIQLVIPISTLVLVNRALAPTARARFRPRPEGQPPTA